MGNSLQIRNQAIQENHPRRGQTLEDDQRIQNSSCNNNQIITELTCDLCIEPFPANNRFRNNNKCSHPFCLDCIAKYIQYKLEDNVSNIPCPDLNCNHLLDPLFCRQYLSKSIFNKWCDLLCETAISRVNQRCYCPNRYCSVLVLNECRAVEKAKCPNCKRAFCFKCQIPWHAGFRCGELRDGNDVLFGNLLERAGWRRCPRCGQCVELIQGCRHVRCRCNAAFCYNCGESPHLGPCESQYKKLCTFGNFIFFIMIMIFGLLLIAISFADYIRRN